MNLRVPTKLDLLKEYNFAQKCGKIIFTLEVILAAILLLNLNFDQLKENLSEVIILLGVTSVPTLLSLAYHFAKNKKKVQDLKPTSKFGHLNKTDIIEVCQTACNRMKIDPNDITFYVTSEKQVNASALILGLGVLIKNLKVVMLNRSTLHALKKEELLSVVAHELAHIYRYPLFFQQQLLPRLCIISIFGLFLYSIFPNVILVIIATGIYQALVSNWFSRFSITIEFLCDDTGAEVAGIEHALRSEFLISKHSEILSDAFYHLLKAKKEGHTLSAKELNNLLEDSLSYDCLSSEELNSQIEANLKKHKNKVESSFFQHLKAQVFSDSLEAEEDLEDEFNDLDKIRKIKTLELNQTEGDLTIPWFKDMIEKIRNNPDTPIFRTTNDIKDTDSSHPGPRRRMLYLWQEFVRS